MISFSTLLSRIRSDSNFTTGKRSEFPVRIIHFSDIKDFRAYISVFTYRKLNLCDYLENKNSWIGVNELTNIVSDRAETCIIIPVSEIIRFYNKSEFITFLNNILLLYNNRHDNIRIYLPMIGLHNELNDFFESYNRKDEYEHVWFVESDKVQSPKKKIYRCPEGIKSILPTINNNKAWLNVWNDFSSDFYLVKSISLIRRWDNFTTNNYLIKREVSNYKDLFMQAYDLNFKIDYVDSDIEFWMTLCDIYEENKENINLSVTQMINKILKVPDCSKIKEEDLLILYLSIGEFERWLLKIFYHQIGLHDNYLWPIISKNKDFTDYELLSSLYYDIIDVSFDKNILLRKNLIESLPNKLKNTVNMFINDFLSKAQTFISQNVNILTDYTLKEKILKFNYSMISDDLELLYFNIPSLREYSGWDINPLVSKGVPENIKNYFKEYNITKIRNKVSDEYKKIFHEFNGNGEKFYKWYFALDTLNKYKDEKIIQIDGLGVEWIPYIIHLFEKKFPNNGLMIESVKVLRAELPSITKYNKVACDNDFIREYDNKIIHKQQGYSYPLTIFEELEMVSDIFEKYIFNIPYSDFYITADHGATCLCQRQFEAVSIQKSDASEHEGRYCESDNKFIDNEYFIGYKGYKVALTHSSLNSISYREVHGGATPEETMIPLFHIVKSNNRNTNDFSVQIENNIITHSKKELEISISIVPRGLPVLIINGESIEGYKKGDLFSFDINSIKKGTYKITIIVDNCKFKNEIEISSGMIVEDMFDE